MGVCHHQLSWTALCSCPTVAGSMPCFLPSVCAPRDGGWSQKCCFIRSVPPTPSSREGRQASNNRFFLSGPHPTVWPFATPLWWPSPFLKGYGRQRGWWWCWPPLTDNRRVYLKAELKTQLLAVLLTKEQGTQQRGGLGKQEEQQVRRRLSGASDRGTSSQPGSPLI